MAWEASLGLAYQRQADTTTLRSTHSGPLRVLKSLYPEGSGICHNVLVHPPGGLVSGDALRIGVLAASGAHAVISTPGATRFYKAKNASPELAQQHGSLKVAKGARMEWVPLESIAFPCCNAQNTLEMQIEPGGQMIGWDVLTLGLPAANQLFDDPALAAPSRFAQGIRWPGHWDERALICGDDARLMHSPLGMNGYRSMGTLWFASGTALGPAQREALADLLRTSWADAPDAAVCGCTWLNPHLLVLRVLGSVAEPVMQRLQHSWALLRPSVWGLEARAPRIWAV